MKKDMFVEAEIWTIARTRKGNAILIKPLQSERAVPIYIGKLEAQSILIGMGDVELPRPLTHDLFINTLKAARITIEKIEIYDLSGTIFYARVIARQGIKKLVLDSRPSDAFAIAIRAKCPVYINEHIVKESSIPTSIIGNAKQVSKNRTLLEELRRRLDTEVEEENYENAAKIRDRIHEIKESQSTIDNEFFDIEEGIFDFFTENTNKPKPKKTKDDDSF